MGVLDKFSFKKNKPKKETGKPYVPEQANQYQGRQIILNSDRILFNAKEDSVLMYADKSIGFCTNGTINFDTGLSSTNAFIVNSLVCAIILIKCYGDILPEPKRIPNHISGIDGILTKDEFCCTSNSNTNLIGCWEIYTRVCITRIS